MGYVASVTLVTCVALFLFVQNLRLMAKPVDKEEYPDDEEEDEEEEEGNNENEDAEAECPDSPEMDQDAIENEYTGVYL
jgi:ABC-type nickel/cobalt efflux system permease component RcnA